MNILNSWQTNLVGYLICMAVFCHSYKQAVKDSKEETASTILLQIIGAISILFLVPFSKFSLPVNPTPYLFLIAASVFYAINNRLQTTARKNIEISTFSVVNQLSFVFLTVLSFTVLRESVTLAKIIAVGLILGGNCLILVHSGRLNLNKYLPIAVSASLTGAIGVLISIGISGQFNLPIYIALTFFLPALMLKTYKKVKVNQIAQTFIQGRQLSYLVAGITWGLAIYFSLRAMQLGQVSVVAPLQATSVLINVITGYLFLEEKGLVYQKLAAASLIILGIYVNVARFS